MSKEVTVYSKPGCKNCHMLKLWLGSKGITYNEKDITLDSDAYDTVIKSGCKSLPVLTINSTFIDYKEYNDILKSL